MGYCPCPTVPICQCSRQYNGAIAPLLPMRLTSVIWYQGQWTASAAAAATSAATAAALAPIDK
eukprot:COSAG01_NODE_4069_length_5383_cov_6.046556_7_plen_63_part_00